MKPDLGNPNPFKETRGRARHGVRSGGSKGSAKGGGKQPSKFRPNFTPNTGPSKGSLGEAEKSSNKMPGTNLFHKEGNPGVAKSTTKTAQNAARVAEAFAGKFDGLAKMAKDFANNPRAFIAQTSTALKVFAAIGMATTAILTLMLVMVVNFALQNISSVAQTAGGVVSVDGAIEVGKTVLSRVGSWVNPFGYETTANLANHRTTPGGGVNLAQSSGGTTGTETEYTKLLEKLDIKRLLGKLQEGRLKLYVNGEEKQFDEIDDLNSSGQVELRVDNKRISLDGASSSDGLTKIINELSFQIRATDLMSHNARLSRSPVVDKLIQQSGVNLERWEGTGKDVESYGENYKSIYDSVSNGLEKVKTGVEDFDKTGEGVSTATGEVLKPELSANQKDVNKKVIDKSWETQSGTDTATVNDFVKRYQNSPSLFTVASYCSASSYTKSYKVIAKQQYVGALRNGLKALSAADQQKAGQVERQTVGSEAQRFEGYAASREYLKKTGADVRAVKSDINESQMAIQNPTITNAAMQNVLDNLRSTLRNGGTLSEIVNKLNGSGVAELAATAANLQAAADQAGDGLFGDIVSGINTLLAGAYFDALDKAICSKVSGPVGETVLQIGDIIDNLIPFGGSGTGETGSRIVVASIKKSLTDHGAKQFADSLDNGSTTYDGPSEQMIDFIFNSHSAQDYNGLNNGPELASKVFQGTDVFYNEVSKAYGGRTLTASECSAKKLAVKQSDIAIRNTKSLAHRLLSPSEYTSPVSLAMARAPASTSGAVTSTRVALLGTLNPISSISTSTSKIAYSIQLADNPAFAASDEAIDQDLCIGYSKQEDDKMVDDPSYMPIPNSVIVETRLNLPELESKYSACLTKPLYELVTAPLDKADNESIYTGRCNAESLSSDEAFRYRLYKGQTQHLKDMLSFQDQEVSDSSANTGDLPTEPISIDQTTELSKCQPAGNRASSAIAAQVDQLCEAAVEAGVDLTINSGWRDPAKQIELRKQNCGTSQYDIYEKPSSQCSPQTAQPGKSNHEKGIAFDFGCNGGGKVSQGDPCWNWLQSNAEQYGLKNDLAATNEAWHWSPDGT